MGITVFDKFVIHVLWWFKKKCKM